MDRMQYDPSDGYLSDVPSHRSVTAHSDVSHDFIESSKTLERNFIDKYKILRDAYEARVMKLSEVVESTCAKLFSDEVLKELQNDKASAVFIPAHLSEVISNSLLSENERYIRSITEKVSTLEISESKARLLIAEQRDKIQALELEAASGKQSAEAQAAAAQRQSNIERRYQEYVETTDEEIASLKAKNEEVRFKEKQLSNKLELALHELHEKTKACDQLKAKLNLKEKDLNTLEQSFENSSRELAMIEGLERQEQALKREMKEQIKLLTSQRNAFYDENQQLRVKIQYASDELDRCHLIVQQKEADEATSRERITELMAQVEGMLAQEAQESNAAIAAVHEKMKVFRQRMSAEIQREKRFSSALQEELATAKSMRDDSAKEQSRLMEVDAQLRDQLSKEQFRCLGLQRQLEDESKQVVALRVKLAEAQTLATRSDQIFDEYERLRHLETSLAEDRAKLEAERNKDSEQHQVDKRTEAYRLHYENELRELKAQLKNSYAFDKANKPDVASEESYKNTIQSWVQENARLKQRYAAELSAVAARLKNEYESLVHQLQSRLEEAASNLDTLKTMVRESKSVVKSQENQMNHLRKENLTLMNHLAHAASSQQTVQQDQQSHSYQSTSHYSHSNASTAGTVSQKPMTFGTPGRRSSLAAATLSPAATAKAVHQHQAVLHQRSVSAPRPVSSPAPLDVTTPVRGPPLVSRRSSTSVLGSPTAKPFSPLPEYGSSAPSSAQSVSSATTLHNLSEELAASQRRLQESVGEISTLKSQVETLLGEARTYQTTIRDLQDRAHRTAKQNVRASVSENTRASVILPAKDIVGEPWDQGLNNSLLQAKIEEIRVLRGQVTSLQQSQSVEFKKNQEIVEALRKENEEMLQKCSDLSISHGELKAQLDQKMDGASTIDSSIELMYSMATKSEAGAKRQAMEDSVHVSSMRQLEESLQHQIDLAQITADELTEERSKAREMRKREVRLFQLLAEVEKVYKTQLHALRLELMQMRATVQSMGPFTQLEVRKTVAGLAGHLNFIFHNIEEKQREELRTARITLSNAHSEEINALEARFVQQIEQQAAAHSVELEKVHGEMVRKAEDALGWTHYAEAANSSSREDKENGHADGTVLNEADEEGEEEDSLDGDSRSHSSSQQQNIRSVSFSADMTGSLNKSRRQTTTTSTTVRRSANTSTLVSSSTSSYAARAGSTSKPAFQSVLTGVLEALAVEDMLDRAGSQRVVSLAIAHQEPSFAAQAAAKSLVAGQLEKFLNALLERTSAASASSSASSSSAVTASLRSYTGTDYNIFFDS